MKHQKTLLALALISSVAATSTAHASLFDRGNGMIYDDIEDITWTVNANINGLMTWDQAVAWADNLVLDDYSDWRLPTIIPSTTRYNHAESEMDELFYSELGGTAGVSIVTTHSNNAYYNLFTNIQSHNYWSGTEYAPPSSAAWSFATNDGGQGSGFKNTLNYAWAVRAGDVSSVPVPGAIWMFGSGLIGLTGLTRKYKAT